MPNCSKQHIFFTLFKRKAKHASCTEVSDMHQPIKEKSWLCPGIGKLQALE